VKFARLHPLRQEAGTTGHGQAAHICNITPPPMPKSRASHIMLTIYILNFGENMSIEIDEWVLNFNSCNKSIHKLRVKIK
jgi:hypothetical protein